MRVAYVSLDPGVPVFGHKGSSVHVQAVLRSLLARGAEVHVVTTRPGGRPPPDLAGVRVHTVALAKVSDHAERERAVQGADRVVPRRLDELTLGAGLDLVYERYSLWGRSAMAWAERHGVPSVLEVNAPLIDEQAAHRVLVDRDGADRVARAAFSAARTVVCVSDPVTRWVTDRGGAADRVFTVANGVDTTRVQPADRPPDGSPFTIGFVGTLKPWHGVEVLLRALQLLGCVGDPRLLIVGDGPERAALEGLAHSLGVGDAVELAGAVDPADVPSLLHRMHVAVAPYPAIQDFYFSPLKVYEYLAAGLPVIASRIGSIPEALAHGELGVLVDPGNPAALATAIAALRDDPARRTQLGRAARHAAVRDHDWSRVVDRILDHAGALDVTV